MLTKDSVFFNSFFIMSPNTRKCRKLSSRKSFYRIKQSVKIYNKISYAAKYYDCNQKLNIFNFISMIHYRLIKSIGFTCFPFQYKTSIVHFMVKNQIFMNSTIYIIVCHLKILLYHLSKKNLIISN